MNDSQLPAEISPKHSRTQGEGDETGKSGGGGGGKSGARAQARDRRIGRSNEEKNADVSDITWNLKGNILYIEIFC